MVPYEIVVKYRRAARATAPVPQKHRMPVKSAGNSTGFVDGAMLLRPPAAASGDATATAGGWRTITWDASPGRPPA